MPLKFGTVTVLDSEGNEVQSVAGFANLPLGAWQAFRSWLLDRILYGAEITLQLPSEEDVTEWYKSISDRNYGTLLIGANLNGLVGGVAFTYNGSEYTVSSHT